MTVRDLGYRAYDGARQPASRNTLVIWRHALRRAWGSWLVKIAIFVGWMPLLYYGVRVGFEIWLQYKMQSMGGRTPPGAEEALAIVTDPGDFIRSFFGVQVWVFVSLITIGAGSSVIAEDFSNKSFQFYFAKPVTPLQYLFARASASAFFSFLVTFLPVGLFVLLIVVGSAPDRRLAAAGLLLPTFFYSVFLSAVFSIVSVAVSSLSKSRALTMSAWVVIFIVPHTIAALISSIGNVSWFYLASLPALVGLVGDGLFKTVNTEHLVRWYHALPVLIAVTVGSAWLAHRRVQSAEVIT